MTSCTWPWGGSASQWPSAHREELRRPGARPTPSAKTLATLGGERVSSTAAGRIGATGRERTLYAAALSLLAALLQLWVTPEHFEEWWGYGAFFVVAAAAQILYVPIVVLWPTRIVLLGGIAGNLAIVVLYLLTRTVGIPFSDQRLGRWRDSASWTCVPRHPSWASRWRWAQRYCATPRPREGVRSCPSWQSGWSR